MALVYLEDYLDSSFTDSSNRVITTRTNCFTYKGLFTDLEKETSSWLENRDAQSLEKLSTLYQEALLKAQNKVQLAVQTYDMVDRHIKRLDEDLLKFEDEQMIGPKILPKKKTRPAPPSPKRKEKESPIRPSEPSDPNEPTYCICKQVSFGEMIACDNDDCPIEWFHYTCVGLEGPVKGKWFCPICSDK